MVRSNFHFESTKDHKPKKYTIFTHVLIVYASLVSLLTSIMQYQKIKYIVLHK